MLLLHLYLSFPPSTINYAGGSVSLIVAQRVDYLESIGAIEVFKYMGTAPFDFGNVELKSRGRYIYNEITAEREAKEAKSQELSIPLPARPLNPVGSPYGFTEDDWIAVSVQKEDAQTLYVVLGKQFQSNFYHADTFSRRRVDQAKRIHHSAMI